MRPYADVPGRRALQILADVLAVTAIVVAVRVGRAVHDAIAAYSVWGERVESAGESLASSLTSIGATLSQIPLVGTIIGDPFTGAVGAADELAALGDDIQERVSSFATTAGVLTAALPILAVLVVWLVPRLRFPAPARPPPPPPAACAPSRCPLRAATCSHCAPSHRPRSRTFSACGPTSPPPGAPGTRPRSTPSPRSRSLRPACGSPTASRLPRDPSARARVHAP